MRWMRGLTRLYIVFWIAFAAHGAWRASKSSNAVWKPKRVVERFLGKHPGTVSMDQLRDLDFDSLEVRIWLANKALTESQRRALLVDHRDSLISPNERRELVAARLALTNERFLDPRRHLYRIWLKWAGLRVVLPGLALLALRWVLTGFFGRDNARI